MLTVGFELTSVRRYWIASLVCVVLLMVKPSAISFAAKPTVSGTAVWHVYESDNFRVFCSADPANCRSAAERCEKLRAQLFAYWLENDKPAAWQPKCQIVLHASDADYLKAVGAGGTSTIASSLVDDRQGRIKGRRIDIRASCCNWQSAALPHEMTHVVLADRFAGRSLPRWADEGMAILADPVDKRARHLKDLQAAIAAQRTFRVAELLALRDYPDTNRWGAFYGQSASLVTSLVERESPKRFVDFVVILQARGPTAALNEIYHISSLAKFESEWRNEVTGKPRALVEHLPADDDLRRIAPVAPRQNIVETGFRTHELQ